jgi:hypothetical protein
MTFKQNKASAAEKKTFKEAFYGLYSTAIIRGC